MDEVGARELPAALERGAQAGALEDGCGDGEPREGEPGERGQDEDAREDRRRQVDEEPDREREPEPPVRAKISREEPSSSATARAAIAAGIPSASERQKWEP